jgi:hypothetical protein
MDRIRQVTSGAYPLTVESADADGVAVTVAGPQVKVYDGAGVQVGTTGTPTATTGQLAYTVPAGVLAALDTYRVAWSGTVAGSPWEYAQQLELCGGFLFEIADLRAFDPALADATRYPAAVVRAARTAAEERLEQACRVAFVPRGRRVDLLGTGLPRLEVGDNAVSALTSASVAGVALTAGELSAVVVREWGAFDRGGEQVWDCGATCSLFYRHGMPAPAGPVAQAAMLLTREYLVRSAISSRATVEATDVGFFRLSIAGRDRPTGLPEVDAVIERFGRGRPLIG